MEPTEPLLGALRSMSHYSTNSDTVQLIGAGPAKMSTASGGGDVERLGESQAQSSVEDSLRKRVAGGSPTSGGSASDEFFRVEDNDPVALALQQCETWVLRPYRFVLRLLGWTQFTRDGDPMWLFAVRMVIVVMWTLFIVTTSITQILSCFPRDRFNPGELRSVYSSSEVNNNSDMSNNFSRNHTGEIREIMCKEHVISSFVFFDILLLFTYWFGLYLFSRGETEYLSNLAEKVFIKQAVHGQTITSNRKMINTILAFLVVGLLWILTSFAVRLMTARTVRLFESQTVIRWNSDTTFKDGGKLVLIILSLIGFFTFDMVYVTAVMNYAAQSEMLVYLLRSVRGLVEQKGYEDIDGAIKDIMEIRNYLRVLNGKTAAATALILYNLGSAGVLAIVALGKISSLNTEYFDQDLATVAGCFNVILWMGLVCFPFIQAARVTDECGKLKETGTFIRTRPYQYSKTPQLELDSYVAFTQAVKLRATMFGIPIHPWMTYFVLVAFTFTMLILFQTNTYSFSNYL